MKLNINNKTTLLFVFITSGLLNAQTIVPAPGVDVQGNATVKGDATINGTLTVAPAVVVTDSSPPAVATPGVPPSIRDNGDGTSTVFTRNAQVTGSRVAITAGGVVIEPNGNASLNSEVTTTTPFEYNIYSQFVVDNATNTPISPTSYVAGTEVDGVVSELPNVTVIQTNPLDPTTWSIDLADPDLDFSDIAGEPISNTANGNLAVQGQTTTNGINNSGSQINNIADGTQATDAASVGQVATADNLVREEFAAEDAAIREESAVAIADESLARAEADDALGVRIDDEAAARAEADDALGVRIDDEAAARAEADDALGVRIDEEAVARAEADDALGVRIDDEAVARASADTAIRSEFATADTAIRTEFRAADTALGGRIDTETAARISADNLLGGRIDTETAARISQDAAIRSEFAAADTAIRGEFAAADTAIRRDFTAADSAIRQEFAAADANLQSQIDENTRGIAMVAAMTNTRVEAGKTHGVDFNIAQFQNETGFAFGYANRINDNVQLHGAVSSTTDLDESVARVGVAFQW